MAIDTTNNEIESLINMIRMRMQFGQQTEEIVTSLLPDYQMCEIYLAYKAAEILEADYVK